MSSPRLPQIHRHESWPRIALVLSDSMAILIGLMILITWFPETNSKSTLVIALLAIGLFSIVGEFVGLYRNWRGIAFEREAACALFAWAIIIGLLAALGRFSIYSSELSINSLLVWFAVTPVISLATKIMFRAISRFLTERGINTRNFAVVGINELSVELVQNIQTSPDLGLRLLGFYDDRPHDRAAKLPQVIDSHLGTFQDLVDSAKQGDVQVVFISLPMRAEERIRKVIQQLRDTTASVYIVPDLFVYQMLNACWTDIQGLPVVSVSENPFCGIDGIFKRMFDIVLASAVLVLSMIPMLLIALAVKLTSPGPVLFRQKRYGLDGKEISVWKFRTMTVTENGDDVVQATRNDARITFVGGFLRRTSLDELPQLINVLAGEMSLVGPRPHATAHNEFYRRQIEGYMLRHKVKPGITGLAQVNGCRGETETLEKMESRVYFDHQYIREWSIWLDTRIMLQTLLVVFKQQNAY